MGRVFRLEGTVHKMAQRKDTCLEKKVNFSLARECGVEGLRGDGKRGQESAFLDGGGKHSCNC